MWARSCQLGWLPSVPLPRDSCRASTAENQSSSGPVCLGAHTCTVSTPSTFWDAAVGSTSWAAPGQSQSKAAQRPKPKAHLCVCCCGDGLELGTRQQLSTQQALRKLREPLVWGSGCPPRGVFPGISHPMWKRDGSQASPTHGITDGLRLQSHTQPWGMLCSPQLYLITAQCSQEHPGKRRIPLRKLCKSREKQPEQLQEGWAGTGRKGAWLSQHLRSTAARGTTRPASADPPWATQVCVPRNWLPFVHTPHPAQALCAPGWPRSCPTCG